MTALLKKNYPTIASKEYQYNSEINLERKNKILMFPCVGIVVSICQ